MRQGGLWTERRRAVAFQVLGRCILRPKTHPEQAECGHKARALFKAAEEAVRFAERAKLGNR